MEPSYNYYTNVIDALLSVIKLFSIPNNAFALGTF